MKKILFVTAILFAATIASATDSTIAAKSRLYSDIANHIASLPGAKYTAEKIFHELQEEEVKRYKKKEVYLASSNLNQWYEHTLQIGEKVITFKGDPYYSITRNAALKEKPEPLAIKQPRKEKSPEARAQQQQIMVGIVYQAQQYIPYLLQKRR